MDAFVARQPILDINMKVAFYELLFRNNEYGGYDSNNGDKATLDVMANSFTLIGINRLTNGKKAFINFTEKLILEGAPLMLPNDRIAVEVLEDIKPSSEVIEHCRKLKEMGYSLALDDFVFEPCYEPLIEIADYIKVDFLQTKGIERKEVIKRCRNSNAKFIAEKVENMEDFNQAVEYGYTYFQGYFFSRPTVLTSKELPSNRLQILRLIKCLNTEEDNLDDIENIIKTDTSLSYKLLKFINSAHFGLKNSISSIRKALVLLGKKELIKWATLVSLKDMIYGENASMMELLIIRAKFGEIIAEKLNLSQRASEVFIMEMLSNIDVLLNQCMAMILFDLPLEEDIKAGLLGEDNIFNYIHKLIISYEKADWEKVSCYAEKLNINEADISSTYKHSVEWATELINKAQ